MAKKTITTTITVTTGELVEQKDGTDKVITTDHEPGTPVTLDADEADSILARFGGEEVPTERTGKSPKGKKGATGEGSDPSDGGEGDQS